MSELQYLCASCGDPFSRNHGVFLGTKMCPSCRESSPLREKLHEALEDFREQGLGATRDERAVMEVLEDRASEPETRYVCGDCRETVVSEGSIRCYGCEQEYERREREEERAREQAERDWERFKRSI
ncbi:MAG: hypothetical protein IT406_00790 [Candidatus Yanofskybacteria bacterium]|nr:hypothetical protein [Candidatus Yanofskybacteria bacterium]